MGFVLLIASLLFATPGVRADCFDPLRGRIEKLTKGVKAALVTYETDSLQAARVLDGALKNGTDADRVALAKLRRMNCREHRVELERLIRFRILNPSLMGDPLDSTQVGR